MSKWCTDQIKRLSDHVHMMIQIQPTEDIAGVVQRLKGDSSRILRKELIRVWSDGYFAKTICKICYKMVKEYKVCHMRIKARAQARGIFTNN